MTFLPQNWNKKEHWRLFFFLVGKDVFSGFGKSRTSAAHRDSPQGGGDVRASATNGELPAVAISNGRKKRKHSSNHLPSFIKWVPSFPDGYVKHLRETFHLARRVLDAVFFSWPNLCICTAYLKKGGRKIISKKQNGLLLYCTFYCCKYIYIKNIFIKKNVNKWERAAAFNTHKLFCPRKWDDTETFVMGFPSSLCSYNHL